jgi:RsiW-degrading membrane proteinase PrsW (M82 family)
MAIFLIVIVFILIAAGLAWFFVSHDYGEKEPIGALWMAFGFGFMGAVAAAGLETFFVKTSNMAPPAPLKTILSSSLTVGLIEESCKFIPLALIIYGKRYFNEHTDGIIYFAIAGLGFGLPENILYTVQFGSSTGFSRIFLTPIFHAATTAIVGFFLVQTKLKHKSYLHCAPALIFAMLAHGLYDFGLSSNVGLFGFGSILITVALSLSLFWLYFKATELDQRLGLSAVGDNKFCRNCGFPNPHRNLYCTRCGQRA